MSYTLHPNVKQEMNSIMDSIVWYSTFKNYKLVGIITGFQNVWYSTFKNYKHITLLRYTEPAI